MRTTLTAFVAMTSMIFMPLTPASRLQAAGPKTVKVSMRYLESFKTTEAGEDEIYLIVSGKWGNGQTFSYRYPNAAGHWDLNDGEGDPAVTNQNLINLTMYDGQTVDLTVLVMEEDGGTSGPWVDIASTVADILLPEVGEVLRAIAPFLTFEDSDDFIGSFSMHIEDRAGDILTSFRPLDRVYSSSDPSQHWVRFNINMNGDGSEYHSQFAVID